ncbi:glycosyltransferase family 2 protein [Paenibacillus sp. 598K]|uniref:glycosyltransferase family 2 protein n=1 Tax=Paenibacillus sp. 598K TaxID=1117987 RepID=UPI0021AA87D8|nr:glycosyltransferase family 2 protein [Paenibacillus sp. 598K]
MLERQRTDQQALLRQLDEEAEELRRRILAAKQRISILQSKEADESASYLAASHPYTAVIAERAKQTERLQQASAAAAAETPTIEPPKPRLGEQLLASGLISQEQLDHAFEMQQQYGGRLGDIVVELDYVSPEQLETLLASNHQDKLRLGDMLLQHNLITKSQLDKALAFQKKSGGMLGDILLSLRFIEPEQLYRAIATQNSIGRIGSYVDLESQTRLPEALARNYGIVIIHQYSNRYVAAVTAPLEGARLAEIEDLLKLPIEQVLATQNEMEMFYSSVYGEEMLEESTSKLAIEQPHNSASTTITRRQYTALWIILALLAGSLMLHPLGTAITLNIGVQLVYFFMTFFKFVIIMYGSRSGAQYRFTPEQLEAVDERELPVYTILVPMYKESAVIPHLLANLERLDYPKAKLDVRLLIEYDDVEAQELLKHMKLPSYYTVIVVPDSLPKTKPKACNFGLIRARGDYVVIYDAEDRPDSDQLKKVHLTFQACSSNTVCVQAKLNYFNSEQNLLTRWFTQEYSMWFELLLPGIMRLDIPIPLGGTSNHFKTETLKEMGAWDPYNVTEDADLGIRLYKAGYKTAIVDSHTWEEANSRFGNWIRQRSRWIKGYMQTWLVHMRHPLKLWREVGTRGFFGFQVVVLATPIIPMLNPIFWMLLLLWFGWQMSFIPKFFPSVIYYLAAIELYLANFFFVYSNIAGVYWVVSSLEKQKQTYVSYRLVKYALLTPLYWMMMSIAAYKAAWQLITKPFYWEKTTHGLDAKPDQNGQSHSSTL